jgi:Fur family ferric uptake transcriptional regulator
MDRSPCAATRGASTERGQEVERNAMKHAGPGAIEERLLAAFEAEGLRNTRPRRVIAEQLAALAASDADFTAQDLWRELQARDPGLGRATVYRAVDLLLSKGMLDRVPFADGTHRYRLCGGAHHHHLTCTQCQRVVEISACLPPDLLAAISAATHFAIDGHSVELFGRCPGCRDDPSHA